MSYDPSAWAGLSVFVKHWIQASIRTRHPDELFGFVGVVHDSIRCFHNWEERHFLVHVLDTWSALAALRDRSKSFRPCFIGKFLWLTQLGVRFDRGLRFSTM